MRVVFMGTSRFAVPSLRALVDAGHDVCGVFTRPDKPAGRGHQLRSSPVKEQALALEIPIYQPQTLRRPELAAPVVDLHPDVICVASYGLLLPPNVLEAPLHGCVNVHASLLPRYRGAAPIQRAILAGETSTGITIMQMAEGLDTGPILLSEPEPIYLDDTAGELEERLSTRGARLLTRALQDLQRLRLFPQDDSLASYAPPITKSECEIVWSRPALEVHNLVRGVNPRPGAFTRRRDEPLRVLRTRLAQVPVEAGEGPFPPGLCCPVGRGVVVVCGEDSVELVEIQPPGGRIMPAEDYFRGHPLRPEERLGAFLDTDSRG